MTRRDRLRWLRLLAVLGLVLTGSVGCGPTGGGSTGGSTSDPAGNTDEEAQACIESLFFTDEAGGDVKTVDIDRTTPTWQFVNQLCTGPNQGSVGGATIKVCDDPDRFPEVTLGDGESGHLFWSHDVIRFHPGDEFDPGRGSGDPGVHKVEPQAELEDGDVALIVIDEQGAHLNFVAGVVEAMAATPPTTYPLGSVITESDIVGQLKKIAGSDPSGPVFINMSFGTYTCGDEPPAMLEEAMRALGGEVHFFASAGNDESDQLPWPAAFGVNGGNSISPDLVTSVGSVASDGSRSCFSNYGQVEAWVVGEEVFGNDGSDDGTWSGTSFAAPQAMGAAAVGIDVTQPPWSDTPGDPAGSYNYEWVDAYGEKLPGVTFCADGTDYVPRLPGLVYTNP